MKQLIHISAVATGYSVLLTGAALYAAYKLNLLPAD